MTTKQLLYFGILAALVFWVNQFVCAYLLNYDMLRGSVSELGAVGTSTQSIFTGLVMLCAVFNGAFVIGLYNACKTANYSVVPLLIPATFSISMFGVSLFPAPLLLHGIFGVISMLMHIAPIIAFIAWRRNQELKRVRMAGLLMFLVMGISISSFFPPLQTPYFGLIVRFFHVGWSLWYIFMSLSFIKLEQVKAEKELLKPQFA